MKQLYCRKCHHPDHYHEKNSEGERTYCHRQNDDCEKFESTHGALEWFWAKFCFWWGEDVVPVIQDWFTFPE
jgi:hypothetical protein